MHPNEDLIRGFYEAFSRRDHAAMAAAYAPDARFSDPVFPDLVGDQVPGMWRMLCLRGKDLELAFSDVRADDRTGSASWRATYTFSATGRKVINHVRAEMEIADGRIVRHTDHFDFWAWSRMALGPAGWLLGWTPLLRGKVRSEAGKELRRFLESGR